MTEPAKMQPQRIKVSRKRQITIPARAYRDMGFTEYALIEQTDEGLLIKPLAVEDEGVSLDVLRRLVAEGYEGEALIERYAAVCPHVIRFEDARATVPGNGGANATSGIGGARAAGFAGEGAGDATPASKHAAKVPVPPDGTPEEERTRVLDAVARECARFEAITRGYVFGSFASGIRPGSSFHAVRGGPIPETPGAGLRTCRRRGDSQTGEEPQPRRRHRAGEGAGL